MAAGSFEIVKQGDTKRIFYSAKNFNTGKTVAAVPYNPAGTAQAGVSFTEIGTSGVYYYDWDSSAKTLGTWLFIVSENASVKAYVKAQVVDPASLDDTPFEGIDTLLDTLTTNLATVDTVVDGIQTDLSNTTDGLGAIKDAIDVIDGNVDTIEATVDSGSYGNAALKSLIDSLSTSVGGLSNNADAKVQLIDSMLIPASGSTAYKFFFRFYDVDGNMEDPDIYAGYQELGLTGKSGGDASGLSTTTQYYFKVNVDGGGLTEFNITTAGVVTLTDILALMNAQVTGAEFSIVGGDIRCTSSTVGSSGTIALGAGTTGTDLFATLTGFSAFDSAVAGSDSAMVAVAVANSAGTDLTANLSGLDASTIDGKNWLTRVSQGVFSGIYNVANTHVVEDLNFSFDVKENSLPKSFGAVSRTASSSDDYTSRFDTIDSNISTVDTNVDTINSIVSSATYGNSALKDLIDGYLDNGGTIETLVTGIQSDINNGTYGLSALATLIGTVDTVVDGIQTDLSNSTDGLGALKALIDSVISTVGTINTNTDSLEASMTSIEGAGFATGTDSLKALSDKIDLIDIAPGGIAL